MIFKWEVNLKNAEGISGYVNVRIPKYVERINLLKELNVKTDSKGEVIISTDQLDSIANMKSLVEKYVVDMCIVAKGLEITSFDDLEYYAEFNAILGELSALLFNGAKLGN